MDNNNTTKKHDYDYVIIGSGFGGSVSAYRLSQKGYKVLVIERGKWWKAEDFPKSNWNLPKWLWFPEARMFGIMKMTIHRHVSIISGAGVGGGSLVYANTLPIPKKRFFEHGPWKGLRDWENDLKPFYSVAKKMLGVAQNIKLFEVDDAYKQMAKEMEGVGEDKFSPTDVGVFFGEAGKTVPDPYFDGEGPERAGCTHCGACMTGCPHNAKNTLDKNYLYLAQKLGTEIWAEKNVVDVQTLGDESGSDGYGIQYKSSTAWIKGKPKVVTAKNVIFSGGVLGTVKLLLKTKKNNSLPNLSDRLGDYVRTNNEALIGITNLDGTKDLSKGLAIGSIINVDEDTHVEPCRYIEGSGFWRILMWPVSNGSNVFIRLGQIVMDFIKNPIKNLKWLCVKNYGKRTSFILFMQTIDSTLKFSMNKLGIMVSSVESGKKPTPFIPLAYDMAKRLEKILNAKASTMNLEALAGIPSTAHILGGCAMGETIKDGVIDKDNKVFGYQNMYVCDGSMISANPGVNPSLSITAITEHAMSKIPNKNGVEAKAKPEKETTAVMETH